MGLLFLFWTGYPYDSFASSRIGIDAENSDVEVRFQEQFSPLYPLVLFIPEDKTDIVQNSFLPSIKVNILNHAQTPICLSFSNLMPEVLDSNGQFLGRKKIANDVDQMGFWLNPDETFTLHPLISLFWEKDELMLVIQGLSLSVDNLIFHTNITTDTFTVSDDDVAPLEPRTVLPANIGLLENGWSFSGVQEGNYQLKFRYIELIEPDSCNDLPLRLSQVISDHEDEQFLKSSESKEFEGVEESISMKLSSDLLPIRVLRPQLYNNIIEVNGIEFETILSQQTIAIPLRQADLETTSIKIGLRVTNNSEIHYRFEKYRNFFIRLSDLQDQSLTPFYSRPLSRFLFRGDGEFFPIPSEQISLLLPGESLTFFRDANLFWENDILRLSILDNFDLGLDPIYFENLEQGCYQVLTWYIPSSPTSVDEEIPGIIVFRDMWQHRVAVPPVEICFVAN